MTSIPTWIKPFDEIFMQLSRRWDCSQIFDDFLDVAISHFDPTPNIELDTRMQKVYTEEERKLFSALFSQWLQCTLKELKSDDWIYADLLGNYYEYIAGKFKRSNFGQFFTPEHLVELMTKMIISDATEKIQRINDPACGSGRMLLSAHMFLKGNIIAYAEDLDKMCCKMTVLNFLIHGVEGEVIHHNSLARDHFLNGWYVNQCRRQAIFSVRKIEIENSYIMRRTDQIIKHGTEHQQEEESPAEQLIINF